MMVPSKSFLALVHPIVSRTLHSSYMSAGLDSELIELENIGHFELIDYRAQQIELVLAHLRKHG